MSGGVTNGRTTDQSTGGVAANEPGGGGGGRSDGGFGGNAAPSGQVRRRMVELSQVPSLKAMCRRIVRKPLGYGIQRKVKGLPLPSSLVDYILMRDLLGELMQGRDLLGDLMQGRDLLGD